MNEHAAILAAARAAWAQGETPLLATVIATRGSSYRKPGARMLVTRAGWQAGSVSGGCLEADVVRRAAWLVEQGASEVKTWDTSEDGEAALGCGGELDVLLEPFRPHAETARALATVVEQRRAVSLAVPLPGGGAWQQELRPSPRLVVCGAGHDAVPVSSMAVTLGWDVHVVDWRTGHAVAAKFPGASVRVLAGDRLQELPLEAGCAVLSMSHHLVYDARVLEAVLTSPLPKFIGVLGPPKRTASLLEQLPRGLDLSRLRAPVGLALGGEGPAAVALSMLAELHAALHGASAASLSGPASPWAKP